MNDTAPLGGVSDESSGDATTTQSTTQATTDTSDPAGPTADDSAAGASYPPGASSTPGPAGPRRLYRSRRDRMLGGVAGGVADYFGIDPVLVRLAFVAVTLLGGAGAIAYVIAWIVVPEEPEGGQAPPPGPGQPAGGRADARQIAGFVLLAFGALALLNRFGLGVRGDVVGPLALIGIGAAVLWSRRTGAPDAGAPRSQPPHARPPASAGLATGPAPRAVAPTGSGAPTGPATAPYAAVPVAVPTPEQAAWQAERRARLERGRVLRAVVLGLLLVGAGVVALVANLTDVDVDPTALLAAALLVVGVALIAGAWIGRPHGFVALGVVLTLAVVASAVLDVEWRGGVGERTYRPTSVAEVRSDYNLLMGELEVDLSQVDLRGRRAEVDVQLGMGKLLVSVPEGVRVVVDSHVGAGRSVLFGDEQDGLGVDDEADEPAASASAGALYLDVRVGLGEVEVARSGRFLIDEDDRTRSDGDLR